VIQSVKLLFLVSAMAMVASCQDGSSSPSAAVGTSSTGSLQTLHCTHILGNAAEDIGEASSWKLMESGGFAHYQASDGRIYFPVPGDTCSIQEAKSTR